MKWRCAGILIIILQPLVITGVMSAIVATWVVEAQYDSWLYEFLVLKVNALINITFIIHNFKNGIKIEELKVFQVSWEKI